MKTRFLNVIISFFLCITGFAQQQGTGVWPSVKKEMHPWTRWWWMGSAVDEKNLDKVLTEYQQAGIGGVEITPIYGAKGFEKRYIDFLSPKWLQMLDFTLQKSASLGMGVDMNTGTGWPFGGPQITKDLAAVKIVMPAPWKAAAKQRLFVSLTPGDSVQQRLGADLQALTAINERGERISILDKVNSSQQLDWTPAEGNWTIYAAYSGKTGQRVKRAAPGGEGLVMDHYTRAAVETYLKKFSDAFAGKRRNIDAFFNDSYEVFQANWSPDFFDTFRHLKGYDLRLYIGELAGNDSTGLAPRIKCDYNEVLGHMLLENFTKPWVDWAHKNNAKAKNQAHGSPGNILDLYSASDIPECEAFFGLSKFQVPGLKHDTADESQDLDHNPVMFRFASSAAHFYNKPLVSSETFVWQTEHFRTAFSECKPEVEQLFLAGINHVYFHGTTYSPQDAQWPGWTFYASSNFAPDNSTWPHLKAMNAYITRCQSVLQAGKPDNELLVYWPVYDQWNTANGMEKRFGMHGVGEWLLPTDFSKSVNELQQAGYSTDFVSDSMLSQLAKGKVTMALKEKVLIVPACHYMPAQTFETILALAKRGLTVVFRSLPKDVPGFANLDLNKSKLEKLLAELSFKPGTNAGNKIKMGAGQLVLAADLPAALEASNMHGEKLVDLGLQFIRRKIDKGMYYYLVNHSANIIDTFVPLQTQAKYALLMDPQNGMFGLAVTKVENGRLQVRLQLQPGEAMVIRTYTNTGPMVKAWGYLGAPATPQPLNKSWTLHFLKGGPELPADKKLEVLKSWTMLGDPKAEAFSGSAEYTTTFNISNLNAGEYILQLGEVDESAHVWINGKDAGIVWSIPFRLRIKQYLKTGQNTIKIEVANLMANRIRDMDKKGIAWRNYHEINFVNIRYKPFDASGWQPLPSGLLGPVTIVPFIPVNKKN